MLCDGWFDDPLLLLPYDGSGVDPNPAYRPPCDGGRSSDRIELAFPIRSKKASLPLPPVDDDPPSPSEYGEGDPVRDGFNDDDDTAPPARDFRVAWAEAGRATSGGGADGVQVVGGLAHAAAS